MSEFRNCDDVMSHGQHAWSGDGVQYFCEGIRKAEEPPVIGADIEFLLDTPAGFTTATVGEITDTVESDLYDDRPGTIDESKIYMLSRNMPPRQVFVSYHLVQADCKSSDEGPRYHLKTVRITDIDGGVVAECPYRVYDQASSV